MTSAIGTVAEIWRYPVKSLGGERVSRVDCSERGIDEDRRWAVRGADGKLGSGKTTRRFQRMPGLLALTARIGADRTALIRFPDGVRFFDGVELAATSSDSEGRLSAIVGEPITVVEESQVSHFDDSPLHLVCTASLLHLAAEADAASQWGECRRIRPNLVLDCGDEPGAEGGWVGRRLQIGEVLVEVDRPTERCVMVTLGQDGVPVARHLLSHLTKTREACFGVYARVLRSGAIAAGDPMIVDRFL